MASKVNALLINFAVEIKNSKGEVYKPSGIISAAGFDLGEEGLIEVPEDDRIASIANGRRKIPEFAMKYRLVKGSAEGTGTHKYFADWWSAREGDNRDITIIWLERDRKTEIMRWSYTDCEFIAFRGEDQEYASPKVGVIETKFLPYDVAQSLASTNKAYA